jgi:hypothetical protein
MFAFIQEALSLGYLSVDMRKGSNSIFKCKTYRSRQTKELERSKRQLHVVMADKKLGHFWQYFRTLPSWN